MDALAFVLVGALSGFELGALVSLLFVLVVLTILLVVLERYVFDDGADPVGLEDLEEHSDNPDTWLED